METYTLSALVTIFSSLLTFYLAYNVGDARRKTKCSVLDAKQSKEVTIANRAHMNTIEISVVFLPLLWIATIFGPTKLAGIVGCIWFISRVWYAIVYLKNPDKRTMPFVTGIICIAITAIMSLYGIVM